VADFQVCSGKYLKKDKIIQKNSLLWKPFSDLLRIMIMNMIINNEKIDGENVNFQLRRKTMNTVKLTILALSAAAIVFSGCSTDNRIAGPGYDNNPEIDNKLDELSSLTVEPNLSARVAVRDSDSDEEQERFAIVAKVEMLNVENGCWYLVTNDGETYTPVTPKELTLESGLGLKAEGYIDKDIQFFCGNGPAFVIEKYELLDMPKGSDDERDSGIKTGNGSSFMASITDHSPADRAPSQPAEELSPRNLMDRENELKKKSEDEMRGSDQPRDESAPSIFDNDRPAGPADVAPSEEDRMDREKEFKKKYEEEQRRADRPRDESSPGTFDDDRPAGPADVAPSEDDQMDRKDEFKKKYEEEQRRKDSENERP
jgi:hypothetical protein